MIYRYSLFSAITCLTLFSFLYSLSQGSTATPLYQLVFEHHPELTNIIWSLRLPRTMAAFTTGGLLALSGALMQLLLQNPLADPYALGISGGSALFTLLLMLFGFSGTWLLGGAWAGSLLVIAGIALLSRYHHWQTHTLLLAGIAMACGFAAGISFILLIAPDSNLHSMLFWLSGDLNSDQLPWLSLSILSLGLILCWLLAPGFNLLNRGDQEARALGLAWKRYRITLYLLSSLFTAAAVSTAGCIGFVGLIIPHMTRSLLGHQHRLMLPACALLGGSLLMMADTLARTIIAPQQLPVGIVTAFIGVPVFIWLLSR